MSHPLEPFRNGQTPSAGEAPLAGLFRAEAAAPVAGLSPAALARVAARLNRPRRRRLGLRARLAVIVGALTLGLGGVALAAHVSGWRPLAFLTAIIAPGPHAQRAAAPRAAVTPAPPAAPVVVAPMVAPTVALTIAPRPPAPTRNVRQKLAVRKLGVRRPAVRTAPAGTLAAETALLSQALAQLRRRGDAAAALVTLDRYTAQHPQGVLVPEAARARVDALFMLGQRAPARRQLEGLKLETRGRDLELMVVRGELRAADDCAGAARDFTAVLAASPPPELERRARLGRAACQQRRGAGAP